VPTCLGACFLARSHAPFSCKANSRAPIADPKHACTQLFLHARHVLSICARRWMCCRGHCPGMAYLITTPCSLHKTLDSPISACTPHPPTAPSTLRLPPQPAPRTPSLVVSLGSLPRHTPALSSISKGGCMARATCGQTDGRSCQGVDERDAHDMSSSMLSSNQISGETFTIGCLLGHKLV
jgi:hypothetical protein